MKYFEEKCNSTETIDTNIKLKYKGIEECKEIGEVHPSYHTHSAHFIALIGFQYNSFILYTCVFFHCYIRKVNCLEYNSR